MADESTGSEGGQPPHPAGHRPPLTPPRRSSGPITALLVLSGLGAMLFAASVAAVLYLAVWEAPGVVNEGSYLHVRLTGETADAPVPGGLILEPDDFPPVTTEIASAIRRAESDERIRGVWMQVEGAGFGWGGAQEIRSALASLTASGKPCVAYAETYSTLGYYLASACDDVVMAPSGVGMVVGLAASTTYYKGTFDKLGIEPEFEHVGDFKTAVEPYERTEPSEASVEATTSLLNSLWGLWLADVADSRGVTEEALQGLVDDPAMSPQRALERGVVDALAFVDQVRAALPRLGEEGWAESLDTAEAAEDAAVEVTSMKEYLKDLRAEWASARKSVAVMHLSGPIVSGEADGGLFGQQAVADRTFAKWMKEARKDDSVAGVVLRVDSPGGSGLASDMMWREIRRFQETGRPVVVSMADAAASGGYYISAPADWVVAQPATITGSIGVFGGKMNLAGTYEKLGMTQATYKRGEQADLFSSTRAFSDEGREAYRGFLQDFYDRFLGRVAEGRDMPVEAVHEVAQGRVWTGAQALERGLVDELGGLDVAVAKVGELAEEPGLGLTRWPRRRGFFDLLMEDLQGNDASVSVTVAGLELVDSAHLDEVLMLQRVLADGGVAALMPGRLQVR